MADTGNNRVLVYTLNTDNSISTASGGHTASYALGQTSMTGSACNQDAGGPNPTQSTLCQPADLAVDPANTRLFVTDDQNNRVLVFNYSGGFTDGMNASYVLGQSNFTNSGSDTTRFTFTGPQGLAYDAANTRLFVADAQNNRVLVFNVATGSIANGENAENVLGQSSYTADGHGHTASTMNEPWALAYDPVNTRLFVADQTNNRVLVFKVPTGFSNGENASYVLGASSFTSAGSGSCTASTFNNPNGVAYDPNHGTLFVGAAMDTDNRVLAFNATPAYIANGENASWALGTSGLATCPGCLDPTQSNLCLPVFLNYDPGSSRLFVIDSFNNRVMIFDGGYAPPNFMKMLPD